MGQVGRLRSERERELLGHPGADVQSAIGDLADRRDEQRRGAFLGHVAGGAGADRAHCVLLLLVHRQHQERKFRPRSLHPLDQLDAVFSWHRHVEQQQVEAALAHPRHDLVAAHRFARHFDSRRALENAAQAVAHDSVIVGDQDARHATASCASAAASGMRARTSLPCPRSPLIATSPPSSDTRSRMPSSPKVPRLSWSAASMPRPLSRTRSWTQSPSRSRRISAVVACAYLATLVSDSWVMRYRAEAIGSGTWATLSSMTRSVAMPVCFEK